MKNRNTGSGRRLGKFRRMVERLLAWVAMIAQIHHEREQLAQLSERELLDMGIDRVDANMESKRDLLDIPDNRVPATFRAASDRLSSVEECSNEHTRINALNTGKTLLP